MIAMSLLSYVGTTVSVSVSLDRIHSLITDRVYSDGQAARDMPFLAPLTRDCLKPEIYSAGGLALVYRRVHTLLGLNVLTVARQARRSNVDRSKRLMSHSRHAR